MRGPDLFFISFFSAAAFIVWTLVNAWLRRAHLRAATDLNLRLLERVGSFKEFNEFLQTERGATFMSSVTRPTTWRYEGGASSRILLASQIGVVTTALGVGLLVLQDSLFEESGATGFMIGGVIALAIGIGFLVSAAVSYWLARRLGILDFSPGNRNLRDAA